jgi:hypothetical protein
MYKTLRLRVVAFSSVPAVANVMIGAAKPGKMKVNRGKEHNWFLKAHRRKAAARSDQPATTDRQV